MEYTNEPMKLAIDKARDTMNKNFGGPFGAAIIDSKGDIVAVSSNSVLKDNDPTAHAEVNAIREASKKLGTYDLSGCVLYATGHPCPMCLSAIIWANIKTVYYGCRPEDAEKIGFRDDFIYKFINDGFKQKEVLDIIELNHDECIKLFDEYEKSGKVIY